jgi:hypothetical protein
MVSKRRYALSPGVILTDDTANEILNSSERAEILAEEYRVSVGTINHVRAGRTWKHLQREAE